MRKIKPKAKTVENIGKESTEAYLNKSLQDNPTKGGGGMTVTQTALNINTHNGDSTQKM